MADEVTSVGIPDPAGNDETTRIEPEHVADDAPFGYKADGTPYKVDPKRYRAREARKAAAKRAPARATAATKAKASPYRDAVLGMIQIVSLPISLAAMRSDVFAADLIAIEASAEPIADAFDSLASQNDRVAAALDKLGEVGPYGLVLAAMTPLILQVGTNHGLIPVGTVGTEHPDELLKRYVVEHGGTLVEDVSSSDGAAA